MDISPVAKRKEPRSKRQRLLAELPVEEVNKSLHEQHDLSSDPAASVYLAAVMKFLAHKVLALAGARAEIPPSTEAEARRVITPESIRGAISSDISLAHMVAELQRRNDEEDEGDEESDDIGEPPSDLVTQPSTSFVVQSAPYFAPSNPRAPICAFSSKLEGETLTAIVLDPGVNPVPAIVWHSLTQNYSNPET